MTGTTLPAIAELGTAYRDLWRRIGEQQARQVGRARNDRVWKLAEQACDRLIAEAEAVAGLILARPPASLADGTTLAMHGFLAAERCGDCAAGEAEQAEIDRLRSAFATLAWFLAAEAGLDLAELAGAGMAGCVERYAITHATGPSA